MSIAHSISSLISMMIIQQIPVFVPVVLLSITKIKAGELVTCPSCFYRCSSFKSRNCEEEYITGKCLYMFNILCW